MSLKTVTICGSMKFAKQMKVIAFELETNNNFNVLQCVYNEENTPITEDMIEKLALTHYQKIMMSEAIYVVDIEGYIGDSVKSEIEYALKMGKEIIYHSQQGGKKYE